MVFTNTIHYLNQRKFLGIWICVFVITLFIILMVQLFLLPYLFTSWHAGNGLLIGGDWVAFHNTAVAMAERIDIEGWSAWKLWPNGWLPAGIASAFYAFFIPEPWVLAPLNAAVHASTYLVVVKIILLLSPGWKKALFSALPIAAFPSAMLWYTQIHRDGYHNLGITLFVYGLLLLVVMGRQVEVDWKTMLNVLVITFLGLITVWLVRPYTTIVLLYVSLILFSLITTYLLVMVFRKKADFKQAVKQLLVIILIIMAIIPMAKVNEASKYQLEADYSYDDQGINRINLENESNNFNWQKVSWLPKTVDDKLYSMAFLRGVRFPESYGETTSGIDYDRKFHNVYDFFFYLPRALQISFLAPFPNTWFDEGTYASTTFFRRVAALEMTIIYLVLPFLIYGIWLWRKKLEIWVFIMFCILMMLPIVYSTPNVGTIYRYRYVYLMLLISVGVAALIELCKPYLARLKVNYGIKIFDRIPGRN